MNAACDVSVFCGAKMLEEHLTPAERTNFEQCNMVALWAAGAASRPAFDAKDAELAALRARLAAADKLAELVEEELLQAAVEFSEPRVRYMTIQVSPKVKQEAADALAAWRKGDDHA